MDASIYTERKILTAVLIGGPLAGAYCFWHTFRALGKPNHARAAVGVAGAVMVGVVATLFVPAMERIPNGLYHMLQTGLALGAVRAFVSSDIAAHLRENRPVYGWGNTVLAGLICMTITIGVLLAVVYAIPGGFDDRSVHYYGSLKHEIAFEPATLSERDADRIAAALTSTGFFDDQTQKTVDAAKIGDRFIITVYCTDEARNPEAIAAFRDWRSEVQRSFPANPIVVDLVIGTPDDRIARLE